jgi:hypothetical protein
LVPGKAYTLHHNAIAGDDIQIFDT